MKKVHYSKQALRQLARPSAQFELLPLRNQVTALVRFLVKSGNAMFQTRDITSLFKELALVNPQTHEPIQPTANEIERCLQRAMIEKSVAVSIWRKGIYIVPDSSGRV